MYATTIVAQFYVAIKAFKTLSHGHISSTWPIIDNCSDMVRDSGPLLYPNTNPIRTRIDKQIFTNHWRLALPH
jgi:hypothetical protein